MIEIAKMQIAFFLDIELETIKDKNENF